ncbi:MAG TPA: GNAT family N-acetyltransferase [Candidatus Sulfomarinibacteraceae bacterium]|nr:GNAT family N-acetyltransferase [Candidatus Sulfomarinibacteraceae bacterium]
MSYSLRPATDDDYHFLYALHCATIRDAVEATWGWDDAFQEAYFRERWDPAARQVVVVGGEDVGVLALEERDGNLFLALIEIAPPHQGRGLGTAIIRDLQEKARRQNRALALHVLKANRAARRLYQRLGFQTVEEREERFVMRWEPG